MLTTLSLTNFRRFDDYELTLKPRTVIVGPNNAGKSTIVDALRLVSLVANRLGGLRFERVPDWLTDPVGTHGVAPSLRDLNTNLRTIFHDYQAPPSIVTAHFAGGESVRVYVGSGERVFAIVHDSLDRLVTSKADAHKLQFPRVAIQPQVAPVSVLEKRLDRETVRRSLDSALAPGHFRNQLHLLGAPIFREFKAKAEATWPTLQIKELAIEFDGADEILSLLVRDGGYVGEVAAMGHGLQMWLQVMWFLTRNGAAPTVVLDEPDVYMHADLQHKLMRLLQGTHQQVVVATHSVEIMAEVDPSEVLVVDSTHRKAKWTTTMGGVQQVIDNIGGVHNLQLSRLARTRRCLFLEGEDDLDVLRIVNDALFPDEDSLGVLPRLVVGGWSGWQKVVGTAQFLRNSAGDVVTSYSIFDSDCHLPLEVVERYKEAGRFRFQVHVWLRKELENYLLSPGAIHRLVTKAGGPSHEAPTVVQIRNTMFDIANSFVDESMDDYATYYSTRHRRATAGTSAKWARQFVEVRLAEPDGLLSTVSGKRVLRAMSSWTNECCGVTFGSGAVAREMDSADIPMELRDVLTAIDAGRKLPRKYSAAWDARSAAKL